MAALKTVKNKIVSVEKTGQVTKAMEAVSAVKMRKSQNQALVARPYATSALKILQNVSGSIEGSKHPLSASREIKKAAFLVITSDRGLAGSLNSAVLKECMKKITETNLEKKDIGLVCIGRKGYDHFSKRGFHIEEHYNGWGGNISFETIEPLVKKLTKLFIGGAYDIVHLVYTNFISTLNQEVYTRMLLPVTFEGLKGAVEGILPESGKFADLKEEEEGAKDLPYIFEPSPEDILEELVPELLKIELYHTILESNASEHSARMIAMKNATDNAKELVKDLRLSYNKARQASITREVNEIVGGII